MHNTDVFYFLDLQDYLKDVSNDYKNYSCNSNDLLTSHIAINMLINFVLVKYAMVHTKSRKGDHDNSKCIESSS